MRMKNPIHNLGDWILASKTVFPTQLGKELTKEYLEKDWKISHSAMNVRHDILVSHWAMQISHGARMVSLGSRKVSCGAM